VTSGVSAVIMPDGKIVQKTKMFTAGALVAEVPLRSSLTPATRLGTWPEGILVLVAAGGVGWVVARAVQAGRRRKAVQGTAVQGTVERGTVDAG
jgi:apolipoprotein N-acyltransferase